MTAPWRPDPDRLDRFRQNGYAVVPQLFPSDEVEALRRHFTDLRAAGPHPGDFVAADHRPHDPLRQYPRLINMHRWDARSLRFLLDERLRRWLTALLGRQPYAVQTMVYFKPPGARGQALHQDQFFLRVQPGTCVAAWLALDRTDEENGCMRIVPDTRDLALLCHAEADPARSFTAEEVRLPDGIHADPIPMDAGDVLFFNGHVIHGSGPNVSRDRFRRSLIGHYVAAEAKRVAEFYHPVLSFDGRRADLEVNPEGGPCGLWIERDGRPEVEIQPEDSEESLVSRRLLLEDDAREGGDRGGYRQSS